MAALSTGLPLDSVEVPDRIMYGIQVAERNQLQFTREEVESVTLRL
jgi:hypothetical protein